MKQLCLFVSTAIFVIAHSGCNREQPVPTGQTPKKAGIPVTPAKPPVPVVPAVIKAAPPIPAPTTPKVVGPINFEVKSTKTQSVHSHFFAGQQTTSQAKAGFTFLFVNVTAHNTSARQETFSSPSFRIVDEAGKQVDATFLGFDNTICTSGAMAMNDWSSISVGGDTVVRFKGKLDSNEPMNSRLDWELAAGKSFTATLMFVIPEQTKGPRFQMAKQ